MRTRGKVGGVRIDKRVSKNTGCIVVLRRVPSVYPVLITYWIFIFVLHGEEIVGGKTKGGWTSGDFWWVLLFSLGGTGKCLIPNKNRKLHTLWAESSWNDHTLVGVGSRVIRSFLTLNRYRYNMISYKTG